jgi:hypothetical protein
VELKRLKIEKSFSTDFTVTTHVQTHILPVVVSCDYVGDVNDGAGWRDGDADESLLDYA